MKKLLDFIAKYPIRTNSESAYFYGFRESWLEYHSNIDDRWLEYHSNIDDPMTLFQNLGICDFLIGHSSFDETEIYVRLRRPGLLIGRAGGCIDFINTAMNNKYNRKFTFILDEPATFLF